MVPGRDGEYANYVGGQKASMQAACIPKNGRLTHLVYHGILIVNSLAHVLGARRFPTKDASRNNVLIALITLGEGWHNNHHYAPSSERQGFYWWEIDISHCILKALSVCGLVRDLQAPPPRAYRDALT